MDIDIFIKKIIHRARTITKKKIKKKILGLFRIGLSKEAFTFICTLT